MIEGKPPPETYEEWRTHTREHHDAMLAEGFTVADERLIQLLTIDRKDPN